MGYNCICIYRQNIGSNYYKTGYHFPDICSLILIKQEYYNKDQVCMGNKILSVVIPTIILTNKELYEILNNTRNYPFIPEFEIDIS